MIEVNETVVIDRPIEEVFAFTTDVTTWTQTNPSNKEVHITSEGSVGKGSTFSVVTVMMGRSSETQFEVTEFEPLRSFGLRSISGALDLRGRYLFDRQDEGSRVRLLMQLVVPRRVGWLEPLFAWMQRRRIASDMSNLKRLIEAQPH